MNTAKFNKKIGDIRKKRKCMYDYQTKVCTVHTCLYLPVHVCICLINTQCIYTSVCIVHTVHTAFHRIMAWSPVSTYQVSVHKTTKALQSILEHHTCSQLSLFVWCRS